MNSISLLTIVAAMLPGSLHAADARLTGSQKFSVFAPRAKDHVRGATLNDHVLTFSAPVQVPHAVLPPGTYVFRPVSPGVMQVLDPNGKRCYATFFTTNAVNSEGKGAGEARFQRISDGMPIRLVAWHPVTGTGFQPVYSKAEKAGLYAANTLAPR